jgi:predicted peptidase
VGEKARKQSLKALTSGGEYVYSGWKDVPVWFLATAGDKAFPVQVQRMFVQGVKDAGADVTLREFESSHSSMLSRPEETVEFILEAVASFVR